MEQRVHKQMSSHIDTAAPSDEDVFGTVPPHTCLFEALGSQACRYVLYCFLPDEKSTLSIETLVTEIQTLAAQRSEHCSLIESEELESLLIRDSFPKLERLDVIEYDHRSGAVRYHQQPFVEEYLEHAAWQELSTEFIDGYLSDGESVTVL